MADDLSLGRVVSVHPVTPAVLQRAVFIAVLSFSFFLAMMFAYYLRQQIGYFLLSTAFLIIYLVMMFSIFMQRKSTVEFCERGIRTRGRSIPFDTISSVGDGGELTLGGGGKLQIAKSLVGIDTLAARIRSKVR